TLTKDATVHNSRSDKNVKLSQLLDVQGAKNEPTDQAGPGDIVELVKLDDVQVGDTLLKGIEGISMPPLRFPTPMIGLAVEPKTQNDQQKISGALQKIVEED